MRLMYSRCLWKRATRAARDGSLDKAIQALMGAVKPEAAYFALECGHRMGILIFEDNDQARMPVINEPMFAALDASVEIQPALTAEDLQRGLSLAS